MRLNFIRFTFVTLIFLLIPAFYGVHPQNVPNKIAFLEKQRINKLIIKKIVQSENTDLLDKSFERFREQNLLRDWRLP